MLVKPYEGELSEKQPVGVGYQACAMRGRKTS